MKYTYFFLGFIFLCMLTTATCQTKKENAQTQKSTTTPDVSYFINTKGDTIQKVVKSDSDWKKSLSEKEYFVLRKKGTESPYTGDLLQNKKSGVYTCRGCGLPLFRSNAKFESGCGWPSFFDVLDASAISKDTDYDIGYPRTELTCKKCGGHLGHVFDDGPNPTGLRYCINAVSLDFIEEK